MDRLNDARKGIWDVVQRTRQMNQGDERSKKRRGRKEVSIITAKFIFEILGKMINTS